MRLAHVALWALVELELEAIGSGLFRRDRRQAHVVDVHGVPVMATRLVLAADEPRVLVLGPGVDGAVSRALERAVARYRALLAVGAAA